MKTFVILVALVAYANAEVSPCYGCGGFYPYGWAYAPVTANQQSNAIGGHFSNVHAQGVSNAVGRFKRSPLFGFGSSSTSAAPGAAINTAVGSSVNKLVSAQVGSSLTSGISSAFSKLTPIPQTRVRRTLLAAGQIPPHKNRLAGNPKVEESAN